MVFLFKFEYNGGVAKPSQHTNEKFLLFCVVGGNEVPFYQMVQNSLILREVADMPKYSTNTKYGKLFVGQQGFGVQRRFYSFYFKFLEEGSPMITVKPFSLDDTGYYFRGRISFLKKSEAISVLAADNSSIPFLRSQVMLPLDVLRSMVTVDRSELKKGIRHVRIGRKRERS